MTPITDDFLGHAGVAGIITGVIEVMKRLNLPGLRWINTQSASAPVILSALAAFFSSLGFQMSWEGTWPNWMELLQNGGTMNVAVVIPSLDTLIRAVGQFVMNLGTYHGILKPAVKSGG